MFMFCCCYALYHRTPVAVAPPVIFRAIATLQFYTTAKSRDSFGDDRNDWLTDRPTHRPTDGRTDRPTDRDPPTHTNWRQLLIPFCATLQPQLYCTWYNLKSVLVLKSVRRPPSFGRMLLWSLLIRSCVWSEASSLLSWFWFLQSRPCGKGFFSHRRPKGLFTKALCTTRTRQSMNHYKNSLFCENKKKGKTRVCSYQSWHYCTCTVNIITRVLVTA